jgi:hypothetical protein
LFAGRSWSWVWCRARSRCWSQWCQRAESGLGLRTGSGEGMTARGAQALGARCRYSRRCCCATSRCPRDQSFAVLRSKLTMQHKGTRILPVHAQPSYRQERVDSFAPRRDEGHCH